MSLSFSQLCVFVFPLPLHALFFTIVLHDCHLSMSSRFLSIPHASSSLSFSMRSLAPCLMISLALSFLPYCVCGCVAFAVILWLVLLFCGTIGAAGTWCVCLCVGVRRKQKRAARMGSRRHQTICAPSVERSFGDVTADAPMHSLFSFKSSSVRRCLYPILHCLRSWIVCLA